MKVYIVVENKRDYATDELTTIVEAYDTLDRAMSFVKMNYENRLDSIYERTIDVNEFGKGGYLLCYEDKDGAHEISADIYIREV